MKKKNKAFWIIILVVCIIACAVGVIYATWYFYENHKSNEEYNNLESTVAQATYDPNQANTEPDVTVPEAVLKPKQDNPIDFDELSDINSDIYAWIKVPNTQVDYPVAHTTEQDENYYLDHSIYKEYKFAGTIYSQYLNSTDFSDPVTVLYGHNMLNGSMFGDLHKFEDSDFFDENKYFYVYTRGHILTYEIFSAADFDNRHLLKNFDFSDKEVFDDYIRQCFNPTAFNANIRESVNITSNDKILVLSTCSNYDNDSRYLVQGVLVDDEFTN